MAPSIATAAGVLATCVVRGQVVTAVDAVPVMAFEVALVPVGDDGNAGNAQSVRAAIDGSRFELTPLPLGCGLGFMLQRARRVDTEGLVVMKMCAPGPHELVVTRDAERLHREEVLVGAGLNPELVVRLPK